jgi:hypothetical protein
VTTLDLELTAPPRQEEVETRGKLDELITALHRTA